MSARRGPRAQGRRQARAGRCARSNRPCRRRCRVGAARTARSNAPTSRSRPTRWKAGGREGRGICEVAGSGRRDCWWVGLGRPRRGWRWRSKNRVYHRSQYDRSRPAGSCWEATGRARARKKRVVPLHPGHAVDVAIVRRVTAWLSAAIQSAPRPVCPLAMKHDLALTGALIGMLVAQHALLIRLAGPGAPARQAYERGWPRLGSRGISELAGYPS